MTTPKSFRKRAGRDVRIAKTMCARDAIGKIEPDSDVFILTYGQFSLIDALVAILDQTGPADVSISTWTAADAHLERTAALFESMAIRSLRMIVDRSFTTRQPKYCAHMRELFGPECIRAIRTHAKFMLVRSHTHNVVVRTSMNLNENPRLENIEVSEGREFADFFEAVVAEVFREVPPGVDSSDLPELRDVPEVSPYTKVSASTIKLEGLNVPATTHEIRRDA